jgi:predicted permease
VLQDVKYAVRVLLKGKAWSAMVVLSLALGIGANTALFSATNGLLLRQLVVEDPESLVRLRHLGRNQMANDVSEYGYLPRDTGGDMGSTFSYRVYRELRNANQTLTDLFAGAPLGQVNVVVDGQAEIATAYIATGNFHAVLGIRSILGRTLTSADDEPAAAPVATISAGFWARRFGSDPAVIGKVVQANSTPVTIVGVLPAEFSGVQRVVDTAPDLTFPLALDSRVNPQPAPPPGVSTATRIERPTWWWLQIGGRLKPGVTAAQVEGNLQGVYQATAREGMATFLAGLPEKERQSSQNRNRTDVSRLHVSSASRGFYDSDPTTLRGVAIISSIVALILLLVCANVANLLLSRAAARQKEIAVRLAIGGGRLRLIRQLLTESVLLAAAGGGAGLLVAYWGRELLPGRAGQGPLDWRVLLFTAAVALLTGIAFGIAPALKVTRDGADSLKDRTISGTAGRTLLSRTLLVTQIAISLVLLIGAGLFLRTVQNLRNVDVGFNPDNLVLFRISPVLNGYDQPRMQTLYDEMSRQLASLPGVQAVTLTNPPLLSGSVNSTSFVREGQTTVDRQRDTVNRVRVAPSFFEALGMPLLRGRGFSERDTLSAPRVAVINEAAVRKFYGGDDPIGRRFGNSPETSTQIEIVGIVRDAKYDSVRDAAPPTMYVPYVQSPLGAMAFAVRAAVDPTRVMPDVREAVRQIDPNLPVMDLSTQMEQIERRFEQERIFARAYVLFGALALLVAAIGLFGLMSYNVTRRTPEIGIRMALGAEQHTVLRMVLSESLILVAIGIVIGVAAAAGAGRLLSSLLFGIEPDDALSSVLAISLMVAVAAIAGYIPARRASRLDPMLALRHD